MTPKVSRRKTLLGLTLALCFILFQSQGCNEPLQISDGFFSAIVRADGKIQTNFSTDGQTWEQGHIHTDIGNIDQGVGITTDKSGTLVFLCFFGNDDSGSNKLFVRTGLGNNWESQLATQVTTNAASAPAICRIDDRFFFIAWNNGSGGMTTALLDKQNLGSNNAFRILGDINDNLASEINGTPSVSAMNNRILVVWRRRKADGAKDFASNSISFNPANGNVNFGSSSQLSPPPSQGSLVGFPQVSNDGSRFVLSISFSNPIGNDLTLQRFDYFSSTDGNNWQAFDCPESQNVLDSQVRPHSIAIDRNARITQLVVGNDQNVGGLIIRGCGGTKEWSDNSAFDDKGKISLQPALVFRRGNQ